MNVVIYHNPDCGTSRTTLAILRAAGVEPTVIDDLQTGWTRAQLLALFAATGRTPREALRVARSSAAALRITAPDVPDEALPVAMVEHPTLINRPFVCTRKGVRLCHPSETVLDLLPPGPLAKEDGQLIINDRGNRIA